MPTRRDTQVTFLYERWRAISTGIIETAATSFLLLIAVRYYHAGAVSKAAVAAGGSLGLLLSPLVVSFAAHSGWRVTRVAAWVLGAGAINLLIATVWPIEPVYVVAGVLAMAGSSAAIPLMTQVYQENYPTAERGKLFSKTVVIRIAAAALFGQFAGNLLTADIGNFRVLLLLFAMAFAFASFCVSRCPSRPLTQEGGAHPFRALRFVREDHLFRRTLICWMLLGFANLFMFPLRVEYLANPAYKLGLTVQTVALVTVVIPNVARLIMSPVWGWLFDRMNFFSLRMTLNVGFALGILTFFTSNTMAGLITGAVIFGISNAGGDVAWSLWV
ncbi:MAG: hypothetical protein H7X97_14260, partial [Opitutaceae bacterium]|nr:hypothetical protein [Verrucomicrobiales bacterium]